MEITYTEFVLLVWAIIATGFAFKFHEDESKARFFLKLLIEDEKARNQMVNTYEEFKKKVGTS
jgi:hypothetical protein